MSTKQPMKVNYEAIVVYITTYHSNSRYKYTSTKQRTKSRALAKTKRILLDMQTRHSNQIEPKGTQQTNL